MNKLTNLIKQLCPEGIEYKKFGEIATISRGASPRPIKIFLTDKTQGVHWIKIGDVKTGAKYVEDTEEYITEDGAKKSRAVKKGDFILSNSMSFGRPYILRIDGCIHDGWLSISAFEDSLLSDYLYYVLNSTQIQTEMRKRASFGGAVQNLNADIVRELLLPVPPLEVQAEIVKILDNFTELTARKKQYAYYREKLLNQHKSSVSIVKVSELGTWQGGKTPSMQERHYWENGTIPWISSKDMKSSELQDTEDHITEDALSKASMKLFPENIVVIVTRSGILKHTLPIAYVPFRTTVNQDIKALSVKEGVLPRYAFHVLQAYSEDIRTFAKKQGGTVDSLEFQRVLDYKVPLPDYETQIRLVNVLDNFETICSDLSIGLPAEIEARQKQYEYYRDLLLTIAETGGKLPEKRREEKRREEKRREEKRREEKRRELK